MEKIYSRRRFFKDVGILTAGILAGRFSDGLSFPSPQPLNFLKNFSWTDGSEEPHVEIAGLLPESARRFSLALAYAIDQIEPVAPKMPETIGEVKKLAQEIAPYFQYEGILTGQWLETARKNYEIVEKEFEGTLYFHLLGEAECKNPQGSIFLNRRLFNKYSPWFQKWVQFSTLVHEMGHMAEICQQDKDDTEAAVELAAYEVMAAMTRHGNKYALLPFLGQLNAGVGDYLLLEALKTDSWEWFKQEYLAKFPQSAWRLAKYEASLDKFKTKGLNNLTWNLEQYGAKALSVSRGSS